MNYYKDPTAWIAIANVGREERMRSKPEPKKKQKRTYEPEEPVDAHKVIRSKHKSVMIDNAWLFAYRFKKAIDEDKKAGKGRE